MKEKLKLIPEKPGCYLMKNKDGLIIYVGKAKNLKRRVNSYFNKIHTGKTKALVSNIKDFEYIVTNSETESLILEINLIKRYNPKYNILLKDDKTYPYIVLTNDKYPSLKIVRSKKRKKIKGKVFGPFPGVTAAKNTVNLINRIYPLKKCEKLGKKLCLYYHINECLGYCEKQVPEQEINRMLEDITKILNGDYKFLSKKLEEEMHKYSNNIEYEKCDIIGTIIYVAVDNVYHGYMVISDRIKDDSALALKLLKNLGIKKTVMLTGDKDDVSKSVFERLNINEYYSELLPQDKVNIINEFKKKLTDDGKIVFAGDGINDAPVIMSADIGISMGGVGSDAAIEASDIVIMTDELSKIATVINISKSTMKIVKQNIVFAISVKIFVLILISFGILTMWSAVFADVGVSVLAILNSIRILKIKY